MNTKTCRNKQYHAIGAKKCLNRFRGCKDHLFLDKTICTQAKSHKRKQKTAWLDMRKAYDFLAHTWIRGVLEKFKFASNIRKAIENSMVSQLPM